MKDHDMSCEELYYAYDFSEKQQRKWLVKIARYLLKDLTDLKISKILNDALEVVERYIRGEATQKELEDAHASAYATYADVAGSSSHIIVTREAAAYACDASTTRSAWSVSGVASAATGSIRADTIYKKFLLEVINEMDELERLIRKKS